MFKIEVQVFGESTWAGNGLRFPTREAAEVYAVDLAQRWMAVKDWRVVAIEVANV